MKCINCIPFRPLKCKEAKIYKLKWNNDNDTFRNRFDSTQIYTVWNNKLLLIYSLLVVLIAKCIYSILPLFFTILIFDFEIVPAVLYFLSYLFVNCILFCYAYYTCAIVVLYNAKGYSVVTVNLNLDITS